MGIRESNYPLDLSSLALEFVGAIADKVLDDVGNSKVLMKHINILYKVLLEREIDPAGVVTFSQIMEMNPNTRLRDLAISVMSSPEFAAKNPTKISESIGSDLVSLNVNGVPVLLPVNDAVYSYTLGNGTYETHVASVIKKTLPQGGVFIDLGANVGVHSQLAATVCGDEGLVYAVDASIDNCAIHSKSLRANGLRNVAVIPIALGRTSSIEFISTDPRTSNKTVRSSVEDRDLYQTVFVMTLDDILKDLTRIDLIKIDVEGREADVLDGAAKSITKFHPPIIAEYLGNDYFIKNLVDIGYRVSIIELDGSLRETDASIESLDQSIGRHRTAHADHIDLLLEFGRSS